jgi:hypothetical protein
MYSVLLTCRFFKFCKEKIPPTLSIPLEGGRCEKIGRRAKKVIDIAI